MQQLRRDLQHGRLSSSSNSSRSMQVLRLSGTGRMSLLLVWPISTSTQRDLQTSSWRQPGQQWEVRCRAALFFLVSQHLVLSITALSTVFRAAVVYVALAELCLLRHCLEGLCSPMCQVLRTTAVGLLHVGRF